MGEVLLIRYDFFEEFGIDEYELGIIEEDLEEVLDDLGFEGEVDDIFEDDFILESIKQHFYDEAYAGAAEEYKRMKNPDAFYGVSRKD